MFDLHMRLFNLIYTQCNQLGSVFGFGAFEGFIIYTSFIMLVVVKVLDARKIKK